MLTVRWTDRFYIQDYLKCIKNIEMDICFTAKSVKTKIVRQKLHYQDDSTESVSSRENQHFDQKNDKEDYSFEK